MTQWSPMQDSLQGAQVQEGGAQDSLQTAFAPADAHSLLVKKYGRVGRRVSDGDLPPKTSYSTALLPADDGKGKQRSVTDASSHMEVLGVIVGKGLRRRGTTAASAAEMLHPRASISVPVIPASEFIGEASVFSCVLSLTNSVMGAGILTLPYCISKMGAIPGIVVVCSNAFLSGLACFFVMLAAKTMSGGTTFSDLGWKTLPRVMKYIDFLNFLGNFGTLVAYLVVIGDVAPDAFKHIADVVGGSRGSFFVGRTFLISLFSVLFLLPMIPVKTFDNLKYVTMFAMSCFAYIVFVTVLYTVIPSLRDELHDKVDTGDGFYIWPQSDFIGFGSVVAIIILAFSATQNAVPVTHELKDNSVWRIALVCIYSFLLCAVIYTVVGLCGFKSFGNDTESDLLNNFSNSWLVTVVRIGLAIAVASCYRMWHHPCRENVAFMWLQRSAMHPDTTRAQYLGLTYGIWLVSYSISLFVNDLGAVMGLIGSVGIVGSVFTVPGLLFYYRCTPAGGKEFYSPTGTVQPYFDDEDEDENDDAGAVFVGDAAIDEASLLTVDEDPVSKWIKEHKQGGSNGGDAAEQWNVWPQWMSHMALCYAIGGSALIPILLIIQILALGK